MLVSQPAIHAFRGEYYFLSNFYPCLVRSKHTGIIYPTSEHAFQAAKTLRLSQRRYCASLDSAGKAKRYGGLCTLRRDWEEVKLDVMKSVVRAKFLQNPDLAEKLMATDGLLLIEGNSWDDTYWGVCNGKGENHLGLILMEIRAWLLNCKYKTHTLERKFHENRVCS